MAVHLFNDCHLLVAMSLHLLVTLSHVLLVLVQSRRQRKVKAGVTNSEAFPTEKCLCFVANLHSSNEQTAEKCDSEQKQSSEQQMETCDTPADNTQPDSTANTAAVSGAVAARIEPPKCLDWYPDSLGWQLNYSRVSLRNNHTLKSLHNFLYSESESVSAAVTCDMLCCIVPTCKCKGLHHKWLMTFL